MAGKREREGEGEGGGCTREGGRRRAMVVWGRKKKEKEKKKKKKKVFNFSNSQIYKSFFYEFYIKLYGKILYRHQKIHHPGEPIIFLDPSH